MGAERNTTERNTDQRDVEHGYYTPRQGQGQERLAKVVTSRIKGQLVIWIRNDVL